MIPQTGQFDFQSDEDEYKRVGDERGEFPEADHLFACCGAHAVFHAHVADHHAAHHHGDNARGVQLHRHHIRAVRGDDGEGHFDVLIIKLAGEVRNAQPDAEADGRAEQHLAQEIEHHRQCLQTFRGIQVRQREAELRGSDFNHHSKEHHGDAVVN